MRDRTKAEGWIRCAVVPHVTSLEACVLGVMIAMIDGFCRKYFNQLQLHPFHPATSLWRAGRGGKGYHSDAQKKCKRGSLVIKCLNHPI